MGFKLGCSVAIRMLVDLSGLDALVVVVGGVVQLGKKSTPCFIMQHKSEDAFSPCCGFGEVRGNWGGGLVPHPFAEVCRLQ